MNLISLAFKGFEPIDEQRNQRSNIGVSAELSLRFAEKQVALTYLKESLTKPVAYEIDELLHARIVWLTEALDGANVTYERI